VKPEPPIASPQPSGVWGPLRPPADVGPAAPPSPPAETEDLSPQTVLRLGTLLR
jgi:hypothetical protein